MIRDVLNGVLNEDSIQELKLRLDDTPGSIDGMFKHMLDKLDKSYREQARLYFSILWLIRELHLELCTLLHFVFMEDQIWQRVLLDDQEYFTSEEFSDYCETFETRITTRCAGLLEVKKLQKGTDMAISKIGTYLAVDVRLKGHFNGQKNLWSHYREVKYIHRSASDFVLRYFADSFSSTYHYTTACLRYTRGSLGMMALLSLLVVPQKQFPSTTARPSYVYESVLSHMEALRQAGRKCVIERQESALVETDRTVESAFRITKRLKKVIHDLGYPSLSDYMAYDCQYTDVIAFASYYGHRPYLSRHPISCAYTPKELDNLLYCTIQGMQEAPTYTNYDNSSPFLELVKGLLHHGANPNAALHRYLPFSIMDIQIKQSIWATWIYSWHRVRDISLWSRVVDLFASQGADENATVFSALYSYEDVMVLEESLLSYLNRVVPRDDKGKCKVACAKLREMNAIECTRFRVISLQDEESKGEKYKKCYEFNESHSDRLLRECSRSGFLKSQGIWPSKKFPSIRDVINSIRGEFADTDKRDLHTFVLESLSCREDHIYEIQKEHSG